MRLFPVMLKFATSESTENDFISQILFAHSILCPDQMLRTKTQDFDNTEIRNVGSNENYLFY